MENILYDIEEYLPWNEQLYYRLQDNGCDNYQQYRILEYSGGSCFKRNNQILY